MRKTLDPKVKPRQCFRSYGFNMEKVRRNAEQMTRLLICGIVHHATALGGRYSQICMTGEICHRPSPRKKRTR
jgi:tRNA G26 N,N-dimethylase Trm1